MWCWMNFMDNNGNCVSSIYFCWIVRIVAAVSCFVCLQELLNKLHRGITLGSSKHQQHAELTLTSLWILGMDRNPMDSLLDNGCMSLYTFLFVLPISCHHQSLLCEPSTHIVNIGWQPSIVIYKLTFVIPKKYDLNYCHMFFCTF